MIDPATIRIGSGQIAAIIGASRFTRPLDVWNRMMGYEGDSHSEAIEIGIALEEPIVELACRRDGLGMHSRGWTLEHPTETWAKATPDRWLHNFPTPTRPYDVAICEAKNVGLSPGPVGALEDWRRDHERVVPDYVYVQVQWQMGMWAAQQSDTFSGIAYVAALLAGRELFVSRVDYDAEMFADLLDLADNFRRRYVLTNKPPHEADGTDGYDRYLKARFPRSNGDWATATADDEKLLRALREAEAGRKEMEVQEAVLRQTIAERIGGRHGIIGACGKVSWAERREYTVREHVVKASRRLTPKWAEEEKTDAA